ncbi:hypothetical protein GOP47_0017980 [Adiantum capillus-veneris]|uniref:RRM domain-containing protein n=1 Tax=Adiantum capillus-veneris TaxID=13818 RepID=A0A9D4UGX0_ADICA|nr:hypothetical protein GOP47_0017980 [Adiantum capillus-veneris]
MAEPSKVLHFRNVGSEISEEDLSQLVRPFGKVIKLVMLRAKNQALVQMQDLASARSVVEYYENAQANVRGRNVYIQFSSHTELTVPEQSGQPRRQHEQDSLPNRILLVTIHNPLYPITVDVLHQVFSPYGFVEKIVTFQKTAGVQALVQFSSQQGAMQARNTVQGRNIYDGCCTLDIQFSNLSELQVQLNNDRTRDYTNASLPPDSGMPFYGENGNIYGMQPAVSRPVPYQQMPLGGSSAAAAMFGGVLPPGISGSNDRSTLIVSNLNAEQMDADKLFNLFSNYGNILRIKFLHNKPDHALVQMGDGLQAELAVHFLKGALLFGIRMEVNYSKHSQINPSSDTHDYSCSNLNRFNRNVSKNLRYCCAPTKMIHVSSLPNDATEVDITAHLAPHGNITEAKVFEANGKKQALVLFESEEEATEALVCKHASLFQGQTIRLAFSKSTAV